MFWTGNPSSLLLDDTPHHQQEGSEKCPVSMGSTSNPEGGKDDNPVTDRTQTRQDGTTDEAAGLVTDAQACGKGMQPGQP